MIRPANTFKHIKIGVPNVADVLDGWLTNIQANKITKAMVDGEVSETATAISFTAMIQPYSPIELQIIPEGERHWEWLKIYTQYTDLKVDDVIIIDSSKYRIMNKMQYEKFGLGYYRYGMVKDYDTATA